MNLTQFAPELIKALQLPLNVGDLRSFLVPDELRHEQSVGQKSAVTDTLLDQAHKEKRPQHLFIGDHHLCFSAFVIKLEIQVQHIKRVVNDKKLILEHFIRRIIKYRIFVFLRASRRSADIDRCVGYSVYQRLQTGLIHRQKHSQQTLLVGRCHRGLLLEH